MRIVFMGTPEFSVPPLHHILLNGHEVAAVFTRIDKPAGRGRESATPHVKLFALSLGLPLFQVNLKKPETAEQIASLKPDAIVVAAFGQILPQSILDIPRFGCSNIHPSLLPRHRGSSPVAAAILAGDEFTGVSIMRMDAGMDTGPVISQSKIPIAQTDTTGTLTEKLSQIAARQLQEVLAALERGEVIPRPQNEALATYSREFSKEDGRIDWNLAAVEIWRRVRALQPWPGCFSFWKGKSLKVIDAIPIDSESAPPGKTIKIKITKPFWAGAAFGVGTGKGVLGLLKVQLEGKRVMSSDEFLRGQREFVGAILESNEF